jgi:hypothetical protein
MTQRGWRLVRFGTAVLAIVAIAAQLKTLADVNRLDLVNFFSYFTIDSNILGILVLLVQAARPRWLRPIRYESIRGATTVYLTVTFVVVIALLQNVDVGLQLVWVDFVLHKLTPVVIVLDWLADPPQVPIQWRRALTWLAFPLIWLAYTLIRGAIVGWYPYPFLDPANGGYGQVAITVLLIPVAGAVVCLVYAWLGTALGARRRRSAGL